VTSFHIEVLRGLDPIRKRPGIFLLPDADDSEQLNAWLMLAIEQAARFASRVEVTLSIHDYLIVRDDGPGLPIDLVGDPPRPRFDWVMLQIENVSSPHARGTILGTAPTLDPSEWGQLAGWGPLLVACSEFLTISTFREGRRYHAQFQRGGYARLLLPGPGKGTGTRLELRPDPQVFREEKLTMPRLEKIIAALEKKFPSAKFSLDEH
jgi:DNA gyrase/topoisomerase IV subunit B